MNCAYTDIRSRLGEPEWWDECAVPRYCVFKPDESGCIYAREVLLLAIGCQGCGRGFKVCMSVSSLPEKTLADAVEADEIHYGDPPNAGCCGAGPTMNSVPRRVLEFWKLSSSFEWGRYPDLERSIDCEWAA